MSKDKSAKGETRKILTELSEELVKLIGINAEVEVNEIEEGSFEVNLKTEEEAGLLIGFRGENINSIQTVLTLMYKGQTDEWVRVMVNIGDYRQKQEDKLKDLADQTVERVIETGQPQPIYNLTAGQRRVIHLYLADNKEVASSSEGEGDERYLVISPRK